jgi:xanthine dehydrogenase YagR molybdenum-binding subunit
MLRNDPHVGSPRSRVDGPAKVTGAAPYAAEFDAPGLLYGYVVLSAVASGTIAKIDTRAAEASPGVVKVYSHRNRPLGAWRAGKYQDDVGPPGKPLRPLYDKTIHYSGQPIALIVAESFEAARLGARLVQVTYSEKPHETDLHKARQDAAKPSKQRSGISPPPSDAGDFDAAYQAAPNRLAEEYTIAAEHHNPMEPHATTAIWSGGKLTVHDKIQGVMNSLRYITNVFGLSADDVRVISPYVGGGFGSGLRPHYQLFLAVMAALDLERPVRVELTRRQMFTFTHRPETINDVRLGADENGRLTALKHEAIATTSRIEEHQEVVVNWSSLLYAPENFDLDYKLARLDIPTPGDMRAPGAPSGVFALESAMDEMAERLGMDPLQLRLRNYSERDANEDAPFTSKELRACYQVGAERFGWSKRNPKPRSMREGRELIGYGMATGVWEAQMNTTSARALLTPDGRLEVATATADIGTGTYTILTQIAADELGLAMEEVTAKLADSTLPEAPVQGGSWTAASAGSAVQAACRKLAADLLSDAASVDGKPLKGLSLDEVRLIDGRIVSRRDATKSASLKEIMRAAGRDRLEAETTIRPDLITMNRYSSYTHSAVFAEVRVDEELGQIRVMRIVDAVAAGRILNPKTARSQIIGGVVWGIGMALHEESMTDHRLGRLMNHNLAEYHVPANADIHDIDVIFIEERDDKTSPLGVKGLGEIGIVGTAAAIANAVHNATGKRIRSLPITIDKVLLA